MDEAKKKALMDMWERRNALNLEITALLSDTQLDQMLTATARQGNAPVSKLVPVLRLKDVEAAMPHPCRQR